MAFQITTAVDVRGSDTSPFLHIPHQLQLIRSSGGLHDTHVGWEDDKLYAKVSRRRQKHTTSLRARSSRMGVPPSRSGMVHRAAICKIIHIPRRAREAFPNFQYTNDASRPRYG